MAHELAPLIVSEGLSHLQRHSIKRGAEALNRVRGSAPIHLGKSPIPLTRSTRVPTAERLNAPLIRSLSQESFFYFWQTQVNVRQVGDLLTTIVSNGMDSSSPPLPVSTRHNDE